MAKVNSGFKMEDTIRYKLDIIAEQEGLSYADLCRIILYNYIKDYEKERGVIDLNRNK